MTILAITLGEYKDKDLTLGSSLMDQKIKNTYQENGEVIMKVTEG